MIRSDIYAYANYIWKSHRGLVYFSIFFIALVQFLLIYFISTMDIAPMVQLFLSQLPPQFSTMFGSDIMNSISTEGAVAFGLEHPLVLTLLSFLSISLSSKHISANTETGKMEIILSHPFKRNVLITTLYLTSIAILILVISAAFIGAACSLYFFQVTDSNLILSLLTADLNALVMHIFILSYSLFFAVRFDDSSKAIKWSAIITFVFYFLDIISKFWDKLHYISMVNFFSYFDPVVILKDHNFPIFDMFILLAASIILFHFSYRKFNNKDI